MKQFEVPEIEIIQFSAEDVMTTSTGTTNVNELPMIELGND